MGWFAEVAGKAIEGPFTVTWPDGRCRTFMHEAHGEAALGNAAFVLTYRRGGFFLTPKPAPAEAALGPSKK